MSTLNTLKELEYFRSSIPFDQLQIGEFYVSHIIDRSTFGVNECDKIVPRFQGILTDKFKAGATKYLSFEVNDFGYYAKHTLDYNYHLIKTFADFQALNKKSK